MVVRSIYSPKTVPILWTIFFFYGAAATGRCFLGFSLYSMWKKEKKLKLHKSRQASEICQIQHPVSPCGSLEYWPIEARQLETSLIGGEALPRFLTTLFFLYKNVIFPAQAEYSYFSADFRLKIFLYYR